VRLPPELRADCSACAGLCCVVPPFDAVQGFGFDKPAETPCRHLCADFRCGIHSTLEGQGFAGCVAFDCLGAGQQLTAQAVARFGSADWRARPEVAQWLFAAYPLARELQELLAKLTLAAPLLKGDAGGEALAAQLRGLLANTDRVRRADVAEIAGRVRALLAGCVTTAGR